MDQQVPKTTIDEVTKSKKNIYIIGGIVLLVVAIAIYFFLSGKKETTPTKTAKKIPFQEELIPTVDPSVQVSVKAGSGKKKFNLHIEGIPAGTTSLEYVITYETKDGGLPGISGTVDIPANSSEYEKKDLLLGTCSTGGACVYHDLSSPLHISVKFIGDYGERLSTNDFEGSKF